VNKIKGLSVDENQHCKAVADVKACMLLANWFMALCGIIWMKESEETDPNLFFPWGYLRGRLQMYQLCIDQM